MPFYLGFMLVVFMLGILFFLGFVMMFMMVHFSESQRKE